jgi:hypothetical protein
MRPSSTMLCSGIFVTSLLLGVASASGIQKRWTNGDAATGTTDSKVTEDCTYWANNIETSDTCESVETYFGITQAQLIAWVSRDNFEDQPWKNQAQIKDIESRISSRLLRFDHRLELLRLWT